MTPSRLAVLIDLQSSSEFECRLQILGNMKRNSSRPASSSRFSASTLYISGVGSLCIAVLIKLLPLLRQVQRDTRVGKDFSHHKTRFCLNMIMKNEEAVLEETFDSLADEIAGWFVCDTGSTDSSIELTKTYFKQRGIPGVVKQHPWKDFSWNRNLCLKEGYHEMSDMCDYWIVFDADQQLVNETPSRLWQLDRFDLDAVFLKERTHGVYFSNLRIFNVRMVDLWEYRGVLHESVYPNEMVVARLGRNVTIGELPEGIFSIHDSVSTRTLEEDLEVLLKELAVDPEKTRTHFYLAKLYHAMPGRLDDALYHFAKRIQLEGEPVIDHTESYISRFALGQIMEELYVSDLLTEDHSRILIDHGITNGTVSSVEDISRLYDAASAVWSHRYEPYGHIAHLYWVQDHDAVNCYEYASRGIRVGSMGDSRTNIFTTARSLHLLYYTKCMCGFHSRQYQDLVPTCKYNLERLPLKPGFPEDWEITFQQASLATLAELEKLGITE